MQIPAPWYSWAENKQKESGGFIDEWVAKYHQMRDRLTEILEQKNLMKDVPTPHSTDATSVRYCKTLQEAGFVNLKVATTGFALSSTT